MHASMLSILAYLQSAVFACSTCFQYPALFDELHCYVWAFVALIELEYVSHGGQRG